MVSFSISFRKKEVYQTTCRGFQLLFRFLLWSLFGNFARDLALFFSYLWSLHACFGLEILGFQKKN